MIGPKVGALRHGRSHRQAVGQKMLLTRGDVAGWLSEDFGRTTTVVFKGGQKVWIDHFVGRGRASRDFVAVALTKANERTPVAQYLPAGAWRARR